jgi:hypothetical protein
MVPPLTVPEHGDGDASREQNKFTCYAEAKETVDERSEEHGSGVPASHTGLPERGDGSGVPASQILFVGGHDHCTLHRMIWVLLIPVTRDIWRTGS